VLPSLLRRTEPPPELRGALWAHLSGLELGPSDSAVAEYTSFVATELDSRTVELIEADVPRTLPNNAHFTRIGGPDKLRHVLHALSAADTEVGYCQSLNYIVGIFLLVYEGNAVLTFLSVRRLQMKLGIRQYYTEGMQQLRADVRVLECYLEVASPIVRNAFREQDLELMYVCSKWLLCLFTTCLQQEVLLRVWDLLLCDGIEVLFRVTLALLGSLADTLRNAASSNDVADAVEERVRHISSKELIHLAYDISLVGHLGGKVEIAAKRREALGKVAKDDQVAQLRRDMILRGGAKRW